MYIYFKGAGVRCEGLDIGGGLVLDASKVYEILGPKGEDINNHLYWVDIKWTLSVSMPHTETVLH